MKNNKVILAESQQKDIVNQFLQDRNSNKGTRFGIYYLEPGNRFSSLPKHVEATVFMKAFNNQEEMLYEEFLHYDPMSSFILAIDHKINTPVGMMRVIKSSVDEIKTLSALSLPPWSHNVGDILEINNLTKHLDKMCDFSTLAILPEYRYSSGCFIGLSLYLAVSKYAELNDIKYALALLDDRAFRVLKKVGLPVFQLLGTTQCAYLGSECTIPVLVDGVKFKESIADNLDYIKKIKLLSMIASKYVTYEDVINPGVEKWLTSYERLTYPLVKLIPESCLNLILYKKNKHK